MVESEGTAVGESPRVRTVLGDIPASDLGVCDYHDHLFQASPILPGEDLDSESHSGDEALLMAQAGIDAMVEATPVGLGRRAAAVARISERTGLAVIHTTGAHHRDHYDSEHWTRLSSTTELAAYFCAEVERGIYASDDGLVSDVARTPSGDAVRAGIVKGGVGYWRISRSERRVLEAVGVTAAATGVPAMVHLEHGSAAWEVLAILAESGLAADRVVLAHIDRNPDPGLHAELSAAGAYLGYDGMARHSSHSDSVILDCLERAITSGGNQKRFVIGADVARRSRFRAYGGMPGLEYLPSRFIPRLVAQLGEDVARDVTTQNPASLLTMTDADG